MRKLKTTPVSEMKIGEIRRETITIIVKEVKCTKCGAEEMHPDGEHVLIRGFKVGDANGHWWSQCLVCSGYYDKDLVPHIENHDPNKGWF